MEMNRLARQNDSGSVVKVTDQNSIDNTIPWLLRTKWPQMFVGKDLSLISRTRYTDLDPATRRMFPEWSALRTRLIADELDKTLR